MPNLDWKVRIFLSMSKKKFEIDDWFDKTIGKEGGSSPQLYCFMQTSFIQIDSEHALFLVHH